jgi:hypothetical protein
VLMNWSGVMNTPLCELLKSRCTIVGARVKFLLSIHQRPTRATGDGCYLPIGLMHAPAPDAGHAAVCPGGVVGGVFLFHVRSVIFFTFFETATDRNTSCHLLQTPN